MSSFKKSPQDTGSQDEVCYTDHFGTESDVGLNSINIPSEILNEIESEDLERLKEESKKNGISKEEENKIANFEKYIYFICTENLNETTSVSLSSFSLKVHTTYCQGIASSSKDNNCSYLCDICNKKENIITDRQKSHAGQKRKAQKSTLKKLKPVTIGDFICLMSRK